MEASTGPLSRYTPAGALFLATRPPLQLPRATPGRFLLATGSINSVYFAYPVVLATLGDEWRTVFPPRSGVVRFFSSPPLWALCGIFTLKLLGLHLPTWLCDGLLPVHLTTTSLESLMFGLSISFAVLRRTLPLVLSGVAALP